MKILIIIISLISLSSFSFEASIEKIKGNVLLDGQAAQKGALLRKGQVLKAIGPKSFFIVKYKNGSKFMVKDGILEIVRFSKRTSEINLIKGFLYSHVIKKNNQEFKIHTKSTVMGVRGTKFGIQESDDESYLCVCEGTVEVENKTGKILVTRNQDIHATKLSKLEITNANAQMWKMAVEGIEVLGTKVKPLN